MIVVCAWCNKHITEKEPKDDRLVTHGMCADCHDKAIADLDQREPTSGRMVEVEVHETLWGLVDIGGEA